MAFWRRKKGKTKGMALYINAFDYIYICIYVSVDSHIKESTSSYMYFNVSKSYAFVNVQHGKHVPHRS